MFSIKTPRETSEKLLEAIKRAQTVISSGIDIQNKQFPKS